MAKKKNISGKFLGGLILAGLIIEFVLPQIRLGVFSWIATLIYFLVGLYLFFR